MRNKIFILIQLLFVFGAVTGQEKYIQWQKSLGGKLNETANAVVAASNGTFIIVGSTNSKNSFDVGDSKAFEGQGGSDFWVVKVDAQGKMLWSKTFGGSDDETATDIVKAHNGDYVIIGTSVSTDGDANFNGTNGGLLIIRINESGEKVSSRVIPGGRRFTEPTYYYADNFSKPSIVKLTNGDLVIGATREIGESPFKGKQLYLSRLTPFGDTLWERLYGTSKDEVMNDLIVTSDGGLMMIGSSTADAKELRGAGNGFYDFMAIKTDQNGVEVWSKAWGGLSFDVLTAGIESDNKDGYILVGETTSKDGIVTNPLGQKDAIAMKVDPNGNLSWFKTIGGGLNDGFLSIVKGNPGKYLMLGTSESEVGTAKPKGPLTDVFTALIDDSGSVGDYGLFGGADIDIARGAITLSVDEVLMVGTTRSQSEDLTSNNGENDFWVVKFGPPPPLLFGRLYSNLDTEQNNLVEWSTIAQFTGKSMTLEKSTDNKSFEILRTFDVREITKSVRLYSYTDKKLVVGNNFYRIKYIDNNDIAYNGPLYTFNFVPLSTSNLPSSLSREVEIYPNPTTQKLFVGNTDEDSNIKMVNSNGIIMNTQNRYLSDRKWEVTLPQNYNPGVYFLTVKSKDSLTSHKVVLL